MFLAIIAATTDLRVGVALDVRLRRDEPVEGTEALGRREVELGPHATSFVEPREKRKKMADAGRAKARPHHSRNIAEMV